VAFEEVFSAFDDVQIAPGEEPTFIQSQVAGAVSARDIPTSHR
jgi:hypothetical protein